MSIVMMPCLESIGPIHAPADTAPGAPRFTIRGELRAPRGGPPLTNVQVTVGGYGLVRVNGHTFVLDSIPAGRYGIVVKADGYRQGVQDLVVPLPTDSIVTVRLARAWEGYSCPGWVEVRENEPRPWWQFWRRRR